jgi:ATP-dependent Lon protease
VLAIDGLKQKCLAAHRAGIRDVVLPRVNERDLDDVPEQVRRELRVHFVSKVDDVLALVLTEPLLIEKKTPRAAAHA